MKGTIVFDFDYTLADTTRFKKALEIADDEAGVIERMSEFLFPESISVLTRLKEDGWNLTLVTIGDPAWQEKKVLSSGLHSYFEDIVYTAEPKETHAEKYAEWPQPLVFINDHGGELDAIAMVMPGARLIGMSGPKPLPSTQNVPVCGTLEEVYKVVANM
ncbi:MAG: HAD family hydrolase [Patescibacteria group bacterium]|jgi:FMN phosphatase YigB (HAD superfamily)